MVPSTEERRQVRAAYQRKWRQANLEKARANSRKSYQKNKATKAAYDVRYRQEHREQRSEYNAQYYLDNREHIIARSSAWLKDNAERHQTYVHRRRASIQAHGGGFTYKEWEALKQQYGNRCLCCGREDVKLTPDHVIPLSAGGSGKIDNIQPLCLSCNCSKRAKATDYRNLEGATQ